MGGRLDHETRQRIRRARSDDRRSRAYRATRLDQELEREMTITSALICAGCQHPFRQHAFGGDCTLANCDCQRFVVADGENGNGHQALERTDRVEPRTAPAVRAPAKPKSTTCKRCDKPVRPNSPVKGLYALLCEEHYQQARFEFSQAALARHAAKRDASGGGTIAEPRRRPPARIQPPATREAEAPPSPSAPPEPAPAAPPPAVVVDAAPTIRITSLEVQQGQWQLYRGPEGECRLGFDAQGSVRVPWGALADLPALIAAVGQAFGATGE